MKKKQTSLRFILFWLVAIFIVASFMFIINRRVFRPVYSSPSEVVKSQLEFPLSKVTVRMKEKEFKVALEKCEWLEFSSPITSHKITLSPAQGFEDEYNNIINENDQAIKISSLYSSEGFSWDETTGKFVMPGNSSGTLVPTWILFKLVSDRKL